MSKRYVVITTPTCGICKFLEKSAEIKNLNDVSFVPFASTDGRELARQYNIRSAGVVIDTQENRLLSEEELKEKFF